MTQLQQQLPELFALARERTDVACVKLAGRLAEIFLNNTVELTPNEECQLNSLIDELLKRKSESLRAEVAGSFAHAPYMPRSIALRVARENASIASGLLKTSEMLTDGDLITIVENSSIDHARAIAARQKINEAVCDALVTTGDFQVMQTVAENLGAHLSLKAMTVLSEAARLATSLQKPVMQRAELTEALAVDLYWWVAQDLRRYALQRFSVSHGRLNDALDEAVDAKLDAHILEKNDEQAMEAIADWFQDRGVVFERVLPKILRMGYFRLFNILLSRRTNLSAAIIETVVAESGGRMLAAVCRAIDVEKPNFVSIFLLSRGARPGEQIVHPRELSYALAAFDRLTPAKAREVIESWSLDASYVEEREEIKTTGEASM